VATYSYGAYGTISNTTGTVTNPFQYAGQYTDAESGLIYLRARYYDLTTGQFLSRDPLSAQTREPYGYAHGDPLNAVDPSGQFGFIITGLIGAAVSVTSDIVQQEVEHPGQIHPGEVVIAAASGGIGGAAAAFCGPACGGAIADATNEALTELSSHQWDFSKLDPADIAAHAVFGGISGGLAHGFGNKIGLDDNSIIDSYTEGNIGTILDPSTYLSLFLAESGRASSYGLNNCY
jgi:RHS repeat-associated protein